MTRRPPRATSSSAEYLLRLPSRFLDAAPSRLLLLDLPALLERVFQREARALQLRARPGGWRHARGGHRRVDDAEREGALPVDEGAGHRDQVADPGESAEFDQVTAGGPAAAFADGDLGQVLDLGGPGVDREIAGEVGAAGADADDPGRGRDPRVPDRLVGVAFVERRVVGLVLLGARVDVAAFDRDRKIGADRLRRGDVVVGGGREAVDVELELALFLGTEAADRDPVGDSLLRPGTGSSRRGRCRSGRSA